MGSCGLCAACGGKIRILDLKLINRYFSGKSINDKEQIIRKGVFLTSVKQFLNDLIHGKLKCEGQKTFLKQLNKGFIIARRKTSIEGNQQVQHGNMQKHQYSLSILGTLLDSH